MLFITLIKNKFLKDIFNKNAPDYYKITERTRHLIDYG